MNLLKILFLEVQESYVVYQVSRVLLSFIHVELIVQFFQVLIVFGLSHLILVLVHEQHRHLVVVKFLDLAEYVSFPEGAPETVGCLLMGVVVKFSDLLRCLSDHLSFDPLQHLVSYIIGKLLNQAVVAYFLILLLQSFDTLFFVVAGH